MVLGSPLLAFAQTATTSTATTSTATSSTNQDQQTQQLLAQLEQQLKQLLAQIAVLMQQAGNLQKQVLQVNTQLHRGMSGDDVRQLQTVLATDHDIFSKDNVTGFFGPLTEQAVKHFQKHFGIDPVGVVGPQTEGKINELLNGSNAQNEQDLQENSLGDLGNTNDGLNEQNGDNNNTNTEQSGDNNTDTGNTGSSTLNTTGNNNSNQQINQDNNSTSGDQRGDSNNNQNNKGGGPKKINKTGGSNNGTGTNQSGQHGANFQGNYEGQQ